MSATHVAVLTPPGHAAIAVLAIRGPNAGEIVRRYFRPAGNALPSSELKSGFRFGRFGADHADEALLVIRDSEYFEIHCHGGRRIVESLLALLKMAGADEFAWQEWNDPPFANPLAASLLPFARTARTASILLDQAHGAYNRAVQAGGSAHEVLRKNAAIGRHLLEPWTVAIAGPPNAGKSTLLNALAGYARSIVSPTAGTTRDAVSVSLAFDGWPVDVIDTAGLRESPDAIEQEGVQRAQDALANSDLCLWIVDATGPLPASTATIAQSLGREPAGVVVVFNKCDLAAINPATMPEVSCISAATGHGIVELVSRLVSRLVPDPPRPGEPVPFTPELCDQWS